MKKSNALENSGALKEIIKPFSIKMNKNYLDSVYYFFNDDLNTPDDLTNKEIEEIKDKNKWFFLEYSKLVEKNNLLKYKLQELILKKNEFHKCIIKLDKLENNEKYKNETIKEDFNCNSIRNDLIDFHNNIYINRKRKRRKKVQIEYKYKCNFKECNKKYASEGALNQHIKFKHL